jgi:uncharacterized protein YjaZ
MKKQELLRKFEEDFNRSRGAIQEIIDHNRSIDALLVNDLTQGDFKKLEEHIEISKLIVEGVKSSNELYKQTIDIVKNIEKMSDDKKEEKSSLLDKLLSDDEDEDV